MAEWIRICGTAETPPVGEVREAEVGDRQFCVANVGGVLRVLDNLCPHRDGPLGQGWVEGEAVICPWHAWAFNTQTGLAEPPERAEVKVYPVRVQDADVLVEVP